MLLIADHPKIVYYPENINR